MKKKKSRPHRPYFRLGEDVLTPARKLGWVHEVTYCKERKSWYYKIALYEPSTLQTKKGVEVVGYPERALKKADIASPTEQLVITG